jgi:hypothetical protein
MNGQRTSCSCPASTIPMSSSSCAAGTESRAIMPSSTVCIRRECKHPRSQVTPRSDFRVFFFAIRALQRALLKYYPPRNAAASCTGPTPFGRSNSALEPADAGFPIRPWTNSPIRWMTQPQRIPRSMYITRTRPILEQRSTTPFVRLTQTPAAVQCELGARAVGRFTST